MEIETCISIVTGAAKGLGKAVADNLLQSGATVIALDKDEEALATLPEHSQLIKYKVDLLNTDEMLAVLDEIFRLHKVNTLVNNAGILHNKPLISFGKDGFSKLSDEEWDRVLNINLKVPFVLCREVAQYLIRNRVKGVIINISSISAHGNIGQSAYSASKAALESFTKVIAKELGIFGIRAACIAPGFMATDSTIEIMNPEYLQNLVRAVPLRRLGDVTEIAQGVKFIIENSFFTGRVLSIDGGLTL